LIRMCRARNPRICSVDDRVKDKTTRGCFIGTALYSKHPLMKVKPQKPPNYIAGHIRQVLVNGGSAPHSEDVQRFFAHEVKSRGWYTAELRKVAKRFRRTILAEHGQPYLLQVADQLFAGEVLEEKSFAVMLLEDMTAKFGRAEFRLFESWLDRITSWADHDGLVHYLIGPMIAVDEAYLARIPRWAKRKSVWHRRAAAVSLIHSTRQHKNFDHIRNVSELLLASDEDMVQKGLGWLLREAGKANPDETVTYLMAIRDRAPRLVLRTACEMLPAAARQRILARKIARDSARALPG
jgi:3-methyladenine DNA glycosylase AlkD